MVPWHASSEEADYGEQPWETSLYADEDEEDQATLAAITYGSTELPPGAKYSPKVPPAWNGGDSINTAQSWFNFEEMVADWVDITQVEEAKRGPSLKARLTGPAREYRHELDRNELRGPGGVQYFLDTLRVYFVRGRESVFLYRLFRFLYFKRKGMDMGPWLVKYSLVRRQLEEAWMDLYDYVKQDDPLLPEYLAALRTALEPGQPNPPAIPLGALPVEEVPSDNPTSGAVPRPASLKPAEKPAAASKPAAGSAGYSTPPEPTNPFERIHLSFKIQMINEIEKEKHRKEFPFREDLSAWLFFIATSLGEDQRRTVMNALTAKNITLRQYTRENIKGVIIDLLQAPKNSLEDPSLRRRGGKGGGGYRSFCILEDVEEIVDGVVGYWAEDEEHGYVGFLPEHDETEFWYYDDTSNNPAEHT